MYFDRYEWRAAWETGLATYVGEDGRYAIIGDKLARLFRPRPGECDTYHENGHCDCQGVSFSEVELSRGALVFLREPVPGVPERRFYVLRDDPLGRGGTLRLARAGEDLETGEIVATEEVVEGHRDYVDALKPVLGGRVPDWPPCWWLAWPWPRQREL